MDSKKTVLITGASSGFGKATAELLANDGYRLILVARRFERLEELKKKLMTDVHIAKVDVTDEAEIKNFLNELPENFSQIDILINNAGGAIGLDLAQEAELGDWIKMIDVNNKGLVMMTNYVLKRMMDTKTGHIVNIGSVAGSTPYPKGNVYGAVKAFVRQFSRNLRADLLGTNIRVTNIEPGAAETEFSIVRFKGDEEKAKKVYENTRALQAVDIANAIKYAIEQPIHVNIDNIEIMPTDQSYAGLVMHRDNN